MTDYEAFLLEAKYLNQSNNSSFIQINKFGVIFARPDKFKTVKNYIEQCTNSIKKFNECLLDFFISFSSSTSSSISALVFEFSFLSAFTMLGSIKFCFSTSTSLFIFLHYFLLLLFLSFHWAPLSYLSRLYLIGWYCFLDGLFWIYFPCIFQAHGYSVHSGCIKSFG